MGLLDMFTRKGGATIDNVPGQPAQPGMPQPQPQPQPQPGTPDPAAVAANKTVPSSATFKSDGSVGAFPKVGEGEKAPLANYDKLWEKGDTDAKPIDKTFEFKADAAKIFETVAQADYTKGLNPELFTKALAGDSAALNDLLGQSIQRAVSAATVTATNLIDESNRRQTEKYENTVIPAVLHRERTRTELRTTDAAILDNPAISPLAENVQSQMMTKYPNESPAQIRQRTADYMDGMANFIVESRGRVVTDKPQEREVPGSMDWEAWATQDQFSNRR